MCSVCRRDKMPVGTAVKHSCCVQLCCVHLLGLQAQEPADLCLGLSSCTDIVPLHTCSHPQTTHNQTHNA